MVDQDNTVQDDSNVDEGTENLGKVQADQDLVDKLVKERLLDELKPIKEKLNTAFSQRDEALKKIAEFEKEKRDAEIARLKEEGKHKEAFERQLAEERAAREALEKTNLELSRNNDVRVALNGINFRNDKAVEMAFQEIVGALVRNEQGQWVHKSGISIRDYVKTFVDDEDNSFLFKTKASSGSGSSGPKGTAPASGPKSLFDLSQAEVLKLAAEGKLPKPS